MTLFSNTLDKCSGILKIIGCLAIVTMMTLTVFDVVGRFFKYPIFGAIEIIGFLAAIIVAVALPYTHKVDGHVGVEILVRLLPPKMQIGLKIITQALTLFLFSLITWQMFLYAAELDKTGEVSMNLQFPVHYLVYLIACGLLVFSVTIIETIFENIMKFKDIK
jgi:TRAP-type C4-dicarboxylate transport system permease small subunit